MTSDNDTIERRNLNNEKNFIKVYNPYTSGYSLFDDNYSEESAKDLISLSFEYGKNSKISPVLLKERGKLVMGQTALELARYYFK